MHLRRQVYFGVTQFFSALLGRREISLRKRPQATVLSKPSKSGRAQRAGGPAGLVVSSRECPDSVHLCCISIRLLETCKGHCLSQTGGTLSELKACKLH